MKFKWPYYLADFMDDLREEFREIKALKTLTIKKRRYEELQDKLIFFSKYV